MSRYTNVWLTLAVIVFFPIIFYSIQAVRLRKENKHILSPMMKLILSGILVIMACIAYLIDPAPWWLPPLRAIPFFYALLLSYSANVWITTGKNHRLSTSLLFHITNILTIIVIMTGYLTIDNIGLIFKNEPIRSTPMYYMHYLVTIGTQVYLLFRIMQMFKQSLKTSRNLSYRVRRYIGLTAFRIAFAAEILLVINLLTYLWWGNTYRETLNNLFYMLIPGIGLIPLTNMVPQKVLQKLISPFEQRIEQQKAHEEALLRYLHQHITTIVPKVRLPNEQFLTLRMLLEIEDARDIVLSQHAHPSGIDPKSEAQYLHQLLQDGIVFDTVGTFQPPQTRSTPRKHILAVAQYLQTMAAPTIPTGGITHV